MLRRMYETKASPFEGELIRLRARERADLSTLNDLFNDPEVLAGLQMPFPQSMAGIREWAERTRNVNDQAIFAIEPLDDREPIGICGLEEIDHRARRADFGIWIGRPFWGRGYGTDATRTICRFGFRHMNLLSIGLSVYAETNPRALRTYVKAGFAREGLERAGAFVGGRHIDVVRMSLLADELPA